MLTETENKFVNTKILLRQTLDKLTETYPKILLDANLDTVDSLIYNIYKFPLTIEELGAIMFLS
jgi:hypothetical protein